MRKYIDPIKLKSSIALNNIFETNKTIEEIIDDEPNADVIEVVHANEGKVMNLKKIKSEDLIFSGNIEDDRTNTYLNLADYDWMNYSLETRFKTEEMGVLDIKFKYFGMTISAMEVTQTLNGVVNKVTYEYPSKIFKKHIVKFLEKHIRFWDEKYAFNGEEEVIEFFNEVLENGTIRGDLR